MIFSWLSATQLCPEIALHCQGFHAEKSTVRLPESQPSERCESLQIIGSCSHVALVKYIMHLGVRYHFMHGLG